MHIVLFDTDFNDNVWTMLGQFLRQCFRQCLGKIFGMMFEPMFEKHLGQFLDYWAELWRFRKSAAQTMVSQKKMNVDNFQQFC